eukprot:m.143492 g.143492  ORF g.143492 m.143492 type:complete len:139 (+) comp38393_c0_seq12:843-1259(+)
MSVTVTLNLKFNNSDRADPAPFIAVVPTESVAFSVLLQAQAGSSVDYRLDYNMFSAPLGASVLGFGGQQQNDNTNDSFFWMFYANDSLMPSGVSSFVVSNGDVIEARYESYQPNLVSHSHHKSSVYHPEHPIARKMLK